jgi:hypothetical protein
MVAAELLTPVYLGKRKRGQRAFYARTEVLAIAEGSKMKNEK